MAKASRYDSGLFEPDILVKATSRNHETSERRLMLAILEDSSRSYKKFIFSRKPKERKIFEEAESWLFSDEDVWPFSFLNLCETLDIDGRFFREQLRAWRREVERSQFSQPEQEFPPPRKPLRASHSLVKRKPPIKAVANLLAHLKAS